MSKQYRAGIIPYIETKNGMFYAFGLDSKIPELGDFGGHKEESDNDLIDTAIREYREESVSVFGEITREQIIKCKYSITDDTCEFFYPVSSSLNMEDISIDFANLVKRYPEHEVQSIVWIKKEQLITIVKNPDVKFAGINPFRIYEPILKALELWKNKL